MTGVNESVVELIRRRRLQLLIHSCIYYEYNESIVTDEQWKTGPWSLKHYREITGEKVNLLHGMMHSVSSTIPLALTCQPEIRGLWERPDGFCAYPT